MINWETFKYHCMQIEHHAKETIWECVYCHEIGIFNHFGTHCPKCGCVIHLKRYEEEKESEQMGLPSPYQGVAYYGSAADPRGEQYLSEWLQWKREDRKYFNPTYIAGFDPYQSESEEESQAAIFIRRGSIIEAFVPYQESYSKSITKIQSFFSRERVEASRKSLNEEIEAYCEQEQRRGRGLLQVSMEAIKTRLRGVWRLFTKLFTDVHLTYNLTRIVPRASASSNELTDSLPNSSSAVGDRQPGRDENIPR